MRRIWSSDVSGLMTIAANRGRTEAAGMITGVPSSHRDVTPQPGSGAQVGEDGSPRTCCKAVAGPFGAYGWCRARTTTKGLTGI